MDKRGGGQNLSLTRGHQCMIGGGDGLVIVPLGIGQLLTLWSAQFKHDFQPHLEIDRVQIILTKINQWSRCKSSFQSPSVKKIHLGNL